MGHEETFARDVADREVLRRELVRLGDRVGQRLRAAAHAGRTIQLKLRYGDFRTITRSRTLADPTDLGGDIARVANSLPGKPEINVVPAGHFAFLTPCSPELAAAIPRICTDVPAGFDRAAFHREFNAAVVQFFREQLAGGDR